jgi:hypothetical protein
MDIVYQYLQYPIHILNIIKRTLGYTSNNKITVSIFIFRKDLVSEIKRGSRATEV